LPKSVAAGRCERVQTAGAIRPRDVDFTLFIWLVGDARTSREVEAEETVDVCFHRVGPVSARPHP
jgi:hypothetical protein